MTRRLTVTGISTLAVVAALAVVLMVLLGDHGGSATAKPTRLPTATLQPLRSTDRPVVLRDLRGPAVVNVWAQWCGPCRDELPKYEAFHRAHPGVRLLGIDWQDPQRDRAVALAAKTGLSYPLVTDPDNVSKVRGLPQLIMIDAEGRIAYRQYVEITSLAQLEGLVRQHLGADL